MGALEISRNYFHACRDLRYAKYWGAKDRCLLALKIASYFTVVVPIGMAITYAVSKRAYNIQVIKEGEALIFDLDNKNYKFSRLMVVDVEKVCSAAKKQFNRGNAAESKELLTRIKFHTDRKSALIMEHLNSLVLIAKAQIKTERIGEALATIQSIEEQIPELRDTSAEVLKYVPLAEMLVSIDPPFSHRLLDKASESVNAFEDAILNRRGLVEEYERGQIRRWREDINAQRAKLPKKNQ